VPVTSSWTNPSAGGILDLATGAVLQESWTDGVASNLLWLGGTTGAWTAFTPTLTQSAGVAVTVANARYMILAGKTAIVQIQLAVTGSGTAGSAIVLGSIPAALAPRISGILCGYFWYADTGTAYYVGATRMESTTTARFYVHNAAASSPLGTTPSFGAANGDSFEVNMQYELA
jgi:hypothetical protein